jgi:hypothetical protein
MQVFLTFFLEPMEVFMAEDFTWEVQQALGTLGEARGGWALELNLVSWGGRPAKYDIRTWSPDHQKMGKGVTLTKEELLALKAALAAIS